LASARLFSCEEAGRCEGLWVVRSNGGKDFVQKDDGASLKNLCGYPHGTSTLKRNEVHKMIMPAQIESHHFVNVKIKFYRQKSKKNNSIHQRSICFTR
jgi:hypothetical protein